MENDSTGFNTYRHILFTLGSLKEAIEMMPDETPVYAYGSMCALRVQFDDEGDEVESLSFEDGGDIFIDEDECQIYSTDV